MFIMSFVKSHYESTWPRLMIKNSEESGWNNSGMNLVTSVIYKFICSGTESDDFNKNYTKDDKCRDIIVWINLYQFYLWQH